MRSFTIRAREEGVLWASLGAALVMLVSPGAWQGVFGGTPLSLQARAALLALAACAAWFVVARPTRRASARVLALICLLLLIKLGIGRIDGPEGWVGRYTVVDTAPPRVAPFFWRFQQHAFRIDRSLAFGGGTFRFDFLNDVERYGRRQVQPSRIDQLPMEMEWSTWIRATGTRRLLIDVYSSGPVDVRLNDQRLEWHLEEGASKTVATLSDGIHHLTARYRKPADTPAAITVNLSLDNVPPRLQAFAARRPLGRPASLGNDAVVLLGFCALLFQVWRAFGAERRLRPRFGATRTSAVATWGACVVLLGSAFVVAKPFVGITFELTPGDDWLAYESNARNVMEEGLLMPLGRPIGAGRPYFFYPLYSYVLAGVHWVVGDDYAAAVLFNGMCAAALPLLLWAMGWRNLSNLVQVVGLVILTATIIHTSPYWRATLTDNLFIPLSIAAVGAATAATLPGGRAFAVGAGLLAALAGATRPSFLLFVFAYVAAMLVCARAIGWRERGVRSALFVAMYVAGLTPFIARNYIMSNQVVVTVTLSHAITVALVPPEGGVTPIPVEGDPPRWRDALWAGAQMFREQPAVLLWLEVRKVLFTLGFTTLGPPGMKQEVFPAFLALFSAAAWLRRIPRHVLLAVGAFIVSHLTAVVIAYPWTYGYKTILPVQYLLLFGGLFLFKPRPSVAPE